MVAEGGVDGDTWAGLYIWRISLGPHTPSVHVYTDTTGAIASMYLRLHLSEILCFVMTTDSDNH